EKTSSYFLDTPYTSWSYDNFLEAMKSDREDDETVLQIVTLLSSQKQTMATIRFWKKLLSEKSQTSAQIRVNSQALDVLDIERTQLNDTENEISV
ncbi:11775_t:CDS:2, partial [Scutellospora calospora]